MYGRSLVEHDNQADRNNQNDNDGSNYDFLSDMHNVVIGSIVLFLTLIGLVIAFLTLRQGHRHQTNQSSTAINTDPSPVELASFGRYLLVVDRNVCCTETNF